MDNYEIESAIRDFLQHDCDFRELSDQADEEHKDIDEACDEAMERAVDYVACDIPTLVGGWMERHGNQIVDLVREQLAQQEPDIYSAINRMEAEIDDQKRAVASAMDTLEGERLIAYVNDRKAQIEEIKAKIATLEGDDE